MIEWCLAFLIAATIIVAGSIVIWLIVQFLDTEMKAILYMALFVLFIADAALIRYAIWG